VSDAAVAATPALKSDTVRFAHASERQFAQLLDFYQIDWEYEPTSFDLEWDKGHDRLSDSLRSQLARGRDVRALDYQKALARIPLLNRGFDEVFSGYDAVLTPATPGTAPKIDSTGDPAFCTLWTLAGMPALSLPLMTGDDALPLGVQLVGRRDGDARLLRTARWLVSRVEAG